MKVAYIRNKEHICSLRIFDLLDKWFTKRRETFFEKVTHIDKVVVRNCIEKLVRENKMLYVII